MANEGLHSPRKDTYVSFFCRPRSLTWPLCNVQTICAVLYARLASSSTVELVAALSDSRSTAFAPADFLIRSALILFAKEGFVNCVALTRFSGFAQARKERPHLTLDAYLLEESDPTINWHRSRGARVVELVRNARPVDVENDGCIVKLQYSMTLPRLLVAVKRLLGSETEVDEDASILSLDLSSMDLVELRQVILSDFSVAKFSIATFFRFSSLRALATFIDGGNQSTVVRRPLVDRSTAGSLNIVGCSAVVAGSVDLRRSLLAGEDLIRRAPNDRPELTGLQGGFLLHSQVWGFDAAFFSISPREVSRNPKQKAVAFVI